MKKIFLAAGLLIVLYMHTFAQAPQNYNLFKPVPRAQLREMETDRPGVTESPQTIDAGHFQYESDLFRYERLDGNYGVKHTYLFNQANLKLGITRSTAVQVVLESFVLTKERLGEESEVAANHGLGDVTLRIKQNIMGNDKGKFAIAVLPYLKFPTSVADEESRYEGGLMVPMLLKVGKEWKLGMQLEADRLQDEEGNGHHNQILETLTIAHPLFKHLDGIAETYYTYNLKEKHWNNYLNASLQFELAKDLKIDGGVNYGIQHDSSKSYFLGLSFRL
ncbi:transporter [Pedobacter chinensis]|uniref:Transporter n=1 Tax=Pedobacter chinensis TaxID=2282421 RepID=A0A369PUM4_9SPHI|nr:transporter [Pedobacter chinensis]RDC55982.1 transporter [Pedobacter chinensis]